MARRVALRGLRCSELNPALTIIREYYTELSDLAFVEADGLSDPIKAHVLSVLARQLHHGGSGSATKRRLLDRHKPDLANVRELAVGLNLLDDLDVSSLPEMAWYESAAEPGPVSARFMHITGLGKGVSSCSSYGGSYFFYKRDDAVHDWRQYCCSQACKTFVDLGVSGDLDMNSCCRECNMLACPLGVAGSAGAVSLSRMSSTILHETFESPVRTLSFWP